ncbi:MAG: ORF6N domain-containing protein [Lachnospiraceae bacterium]|nr:ORF6N domain-containing protein [Lachnospiraceae bacterium]
MKEGIAVNRQTREVYETQADNIKTNFNSDKERFTEGAHYFLLRGAELKVFKNQVNDFHPVCKHSASLYLWTRRGASRHCKMPGWGSRTLPRSGHHQTLRPAALTAKIEASPRKALGG